MKVKSSPIKGGSCSFKELKYTLEDTPPPPLRLRITLLKITLNPGLIVTQLGPSELLAPSHL